MPNNLESCNAPNFIIKDFVTRTGSHYGFFNNNGIISIAAQCTVFEFLIDAPENYGISNEKYRTTIFMDRADCNRQLPENGYQISCNTLCDTSAFLAWAHQTIRALLQPLIMQGMTGTDATSLVSVLQQEPSQRFAFQTFSLSEFYKNISSYSKLNTSSGLFVVISSGNDLSLDTYNKIGEQIDRMLDDNCVVHVGTCIYPKQEQIDVAILYGLSPSN